MLPPIRHLTPDSSGVGFFVCTQKDVRPGRNGEFLSLTLQDATGRIVARVFDEVDRLKGEFEAGEFVKVRARANVYNDRMQLIVENIRRVHLEQDRKDGFREEDCVISSSRPVEEMWVELQGRIAGVGNPFIRQLLEAIVGAHEARLRVWPAAQTLHHAYRGGFLEHVLQMAQVGEMLAGAYHADADLVMAGALLHDIGKLQELDYELATSYSREGRLLGHIMLGSALVRDAASGIAGFPPLLLTELQHLILSHHGCLEYGSPVAPMTVEAFILSFVDDMDAKINMVRQAIRDDTGDGEFTGYHSRLERVFWKGAEQGPKRGG
jgi:3'-5' exoribonuclease